MQDYKCVFASSLVSTSMKDMEREFLGQNFVLFIWWKLIHDG